MPGVRQLGQVESKKDNHAKRVYTGWRWNSKSKFGGRISTDCTRTTGWIGHYVTRSGGPIWSSVPTDKTWKTTDILLTTWPSSSTKAKTFSLPLKRPLTLHVPRRARQGACKVRKTPPIPHPRPSPYTAEGSTGRSDSPSLRAERELGGEVFLTLHVPRRARRLK